MPVHNMGSLFQKSQIQKKQDIQACESRLSDKDALHHFLALCHQIRDTHKLLEDNAYLSTSLRDLTMYLYSFSLR